MLKVVSFPMNEVYYAGSHSDTPPEREELTGVVRSALVSGGVHVYDVSMTSLTVTGTPATGETVHWLVEVTLPVEDVDALVAHHSSASFLAFVEGGAIALGGSHQNSLYQTSNAVDTSAAPFGGSAPSPPPSARRQRK
jgi:hypothetical protein